MFHTWGLTWHESQTWYFVSLCWQIDNLPPWFHLCNLWRQPTVTIFNQSQSVSPPPPVALSPNSVLSMSCVPDAVFQSLEQNVTQMHRSSHQLLDNCILHLMCKTISTQWEAMLRDMAAKLVRRTHKIAGARKLYYWPFSVPTMSSRTLSYAFCTVLDTNYEWINSNVEGSKNMPQFPFSELIKNTKTISQDIQLSGINQIWMWKM